MHNRDQFAQRFAQPGSKPHQPAALLRGDRDSRRQLAPQDLVLNLQVRDLPGKLFLRGTGNQEEQLRVDVPHRGCRRKLLSSMGLTSFWHPGAGVAKAEKRGSGLGSQPHVRSVAAAALSALSREREIFSDLLTGREKCP